MKQNKKYNKKELIGALLFLIPLAAFIVSFVLIPVIGTISTSLFRDVDFMSRKFLGLQNYISLLSEPSFWQSFKFTMLFVGVSVPLQMVLGLLFAAVLNQPLPFRGLLRACILIPWAVPSAISARIWELIYNYNYGLINYLLTVLHITKAPVNWLGSGFGAFTAVVLSDTWKTTPFVALILLAGLSAIPRTLYEQAKVDGANFIQQFFGITMPMLRPVFIVALLFRTIDALRIFDLIYVLTLGGPGGATNSLSMYGYKYFLSGDFGYGSTVSVILFLIAFGLSVLYIKLGKFNEVVSA